MRYTATDGTVATGIVWCPGPVPGSVWVLPYSGASSSEACVVSVWRQRELRNEHVSMRRAAWNFDDRGRESDAGRRLSDKDWHAALGFDPAEQVRAAEAAGEQVALDLTA